MTPLSYAALGSSFASGPGIEPLVDVAAMRSAGNYPHLLARALGATLTDLTISGATTATILDERQVTMWGAEFPPQLAGLPTSADLVTVTAGGNDLRYMGALLFTAWTRAQPGGQIATMLAADFPDGLPVPSAADVERTASGLAEIVARVRERAPRARVLLVDYLTILGPDTAAPFEPAEVALFREIQAALETAYEKAAASSGAELIAASRISRSHALGAARPWIAPFSTAPADTMGSFHPNAAGMAAVADLIVAHLA
ncbi:SGNH/GDSL hydrolase family protein [Actinoplanes sp. NPDC051851]|uniref:SGNH/GDSL hydrolase family protein n=1 Tax=Actinoplanes sp. NPDC051851 TaxID=3154753 RepID=UPI00342F63B4